MPTKELAYFDSTINSTIALVFVASFALGTGLVVWHAAVGNNPIADFIAQSHLVDAAAQ